MKAQTSLPPACALAALLATTTASAVSLDDIEFWAGSGSQRAALVIDWNDGNGPESLVWGFQWDGIATGLDMLQAVVAADPRLYAHFGEFAWGTATLGIGYDLNESGGFDVTPGLAFDPAGIALSTGGSSADDSRSAVDPGDHYREGWNSGFWAYYIKSSEAEDWLSPVSGSADRLLTDGAWDGYSFAPDFDGPLPGEPSIVAVPEPSAARILVLGSLAWLCARRSRP